MLGCGASDTRLARSDVTWCECVLTKGRGGTLYRTNANLPSCDDKSEGYSTCTGLLWFAHASLLGAG